MAQSQGGRRKAPQIKRRKIIEGLKESLLMVMEDFHPLLLPWDLRLTPEQFEMIHCK